MSQPSVQQLIDAGISRTHAYDILAGREKPSLAVALRIYDATKAQLGILRGLPRSTIEQLRANASDQDEAA